MASPSGSDHGGGDFEVIDRQEILNDIITWLQPTDFNAESSEFQRHLSSQAPGTGEWIVNTDQYQYWHGSANNASLWIKGVPGAGKSVIAASMVSHLQRTQEVPVLFFFFRYIIAANRTARSLTRDWLAQLVPHSIQLQDILQPLQTSDLDDISDKQLWDYLLAGLSSVDKAYCVVDALDEMELASNDKFLERLNSLATFRPASVKLLMTSRPKQYLQSSLKDSSIVHISLQQDLVGKDIASFVSHRLKESIHDSKSRESLTAAICSKSQGLFLYARLLIDQILDAVSSNKQADALALANDLPVGLEQMYDNVLYQQANDLNLDVEVQKFILTLVTHSSSALRLNEVADSLHFAFPDLGSAPKKIVRTSCGPLLEILEDETVQIIHHSFTEYLLGSEQAHVSGGFPRRFPIIDPLQAHKELTTHCVGYIRSGALTEEEYTAKGIRYQEYCFECREIGCWHLGVNPNYYSIDSARYEFPFVQYAVTNWAHHASHCDISDPSFLATITNFLKSDGKDFLHWASHEWSPNVLLPDSKLPGVLHIAAFTGLTELAKLALDEGDDPDVLDLDERTPLWWAANRGHTKMAELLFSRGASPNPGPENSGTLPIHQAAKKNSSAILKMLLERGVDVSAPALPPKRSEQNGFYHGALKTQDHTPAKFALDSGHVEAIEVILPYLSDDALMELVCGSCLQKKLEIFELAMGNSKLDVNAKFLGATPLFFACHAINLEAVETLIERGADVNMDCKSSPLHANRGLINHDSTPLHTMISAYKTSCDSSWQKIFKLLVDAGVDLEHRDSDGSTPLHLATQWPLDQNEQVSANVFSALLEAGADASAVDDNGDNALHLLLRSWPQISLIDLLLKHGASIESRGYGGSTILHQLFHIYAIDFDLGSRIDIMKFLLAKGAGPLCRVVDDDGVSIPERCLRNNDRDPELLKLIFENCPDLDIWSRAIFHLPFGPDKSKNTNIIKELLSYGISLESRDDDGRTTLLAHMSSDPMAECLLECGAKVDAVDSKGQGILHYRISTYGLISEESLQKYIDLGINVQMIDVDGNTLLHQAARFYMDTPDYANAVKLFVRSGIDVNAKNNEGCTALHVFLEDNTHGISSERLDLSFDSLMVSLGADLNIQDREGVALIHLAAMKCESDVDKLLSAGADIKIRSKDKSNVLHFAARARRSDVLSLLLHRLGSTMNGQTDSMGRTPLHLACMSGRPESVYYLLKSGFDVKAKDKEGRTPLHSCAEYSLEQKRYFVLDHTDINRQSSLKEKDRYRPQDGDSMSRGRNTVWYKNRYSFSSDKPGDITTIIKMLLDAGASVTARDHRRNMPLDLAGYYELPEMVDALRPHVQEMKSVKKFEKNDMSYEATVALSLTPKHSALTDDSFPLKSVLDEPATFYSLLKHDDLDVLLQKGATWTKSRIDSTDRCIMHPAAEQGYVKFIERLGSLAKCFDDHEQVIRAMPSTEGPDAVIPCANIKPILHAACERKLPNLEMIRVLVDTCGVDVNARAVVLDLPQRVKAVPGPTALHILAKARSWWQLDAIRYLVSKGANVDSRNELGETPLHIASQGKNGRDRTGYWYLASVELLLDLGADPNALDNKGNTPVGNAGSTTDVLKTLLKRGGDITAGTTSPLFLAAREFKMESLAIILDSGVDINTKKPLKTLDLHLSYSPPDMGISPFLYACCMDSYSLNDKVANTIKFMVDHGADLYQPVTEDETLIHFVFEFSSYTVCQALIDYGDKIDFNRKDQHGRTVTAAAGRWERTILDHEGPKDDKKKITPIVQLLDLGADVMATDDEGRTLLHQALSNAAMEDDVLLQIIDHPRCKPILFLKDTKGCTPLHISLAIFRSRVYERLVALGADRLETGPGKLSALHYLAGEYVGREMTRTTLNSADVRGENSKIQAKMVEIWKSSVDMIGDINVGDELGSPPLFHFVSGPCTGFRPWKGEEDYTEERRCCHLDALPQLFEGADFHVRNNGGANVLHMIACRDQSRSWAREDEDKHDKTLFDYFVSKGVDPLAEDSKGRSSLDLANAHGKTAILESFKYRG